MRRFEITISKCLQREKLLNVSFSSDSHRMVTRRGRKKALRSKEFRNVRNTLEKYSFESNKKLEIAVVINVTR